MNRGPMDQSSLSKAKGEIHGNNLGLEKKKPPEKREEKNRPEDVPKPTFREGHHRNSRQDPVFNLLQKRKKPDREKGESVRCDRETRSRLGGWEKEK